MKVKNHYDVGSPGHWAARRDAVFALPSARGNDPHSLSEAQAHRDASTANMSRYETVAQMDAQLDQRAKSGASSLGALPTPPPTSGFGLFAGLLFFAAGALIAYAVTAGKREGEGEGEDLALPGAETTSPSPSVPVQNPAPTAPVVNNPVSVSVTQTAPEAPAPAAPAVTVNPAVVEPRRRRRRPRLRPQSVETSKT